MIWIISITLLLITISFLTDLFDNKLGIWFGCFSIGLFVTLMVTLVAFQDDKEKCNLTETKIEIHSIHQQKDGKYFVLDSEYNKMYPEIKIVDNDSKLIKNNYKQKNWFLDIVVFDFEENILYLNLQDVKN